MKRMGTPGLFLSLLFLSLLLGACSKQNLTSQQPTDLPENSALSKENGITKKRFPEFDSANCSLSFIIAPDIEKDCSVTDFGLVLSEYFSELTSDPDFDLSLVEYYKNLNTKYVSYFEGTNYYGERGEYNQLAKKRIRELSVFWDLDREIYLNGQHTAFLDDRETLAAMIESFDNTVRNRTEAYQKADALIAFNKTSANFPENPTFALDAFTKSNGLLVIGDGILETLAESGIEENIAFTGIIAHEWWHQAQFEYSEEWTFKNELNSIAERSRYSELEADFAAAYFMAHKRGATYNWKKIENYFQLSFNVGDCLVNSNQHHGTPVQRLAAAKFGYDLAYSAKKKGHILSPEVVHQEFLKYYTELIAMRIMQ